MDKILLTITFLDALYFGNFYLFMWIMHVYALLSTKIGIRSLFKNPSLIANYSNPPFIFKLITLIEIAHYIACILYFPLQSRKKYKDTYMMILHHFICLGLMISAWIYPKFAFII